MAFDWLEHDGRRSVSEMERVGTVLPIRDSRQSFRADNQDSSNSRRDKGRCRDQSVRKPGTG